MKKAALLVAVLGLAGLGVSCLFTGVSSARKHVTGSLFRDVTERSGVTFRFHGDIIDGKLIPTMGGGASLADADGDGDLDVVFVQQVKSGNKYRKAGKTQPLSSCALFYRNRGDGTFEDVTEASGLRACGWGVTAMWADLDADGDPDLVIGNAGEPATLWENVTSPGGAPKLELKRESGLNASRFTIGLTALDLDADGTADVYVGNYLDTDPDRESNTKGLAFKTPDEYPGQDNAFFHGLGGLRFEEVPGAAGAIDPGSKTIGAAALDFDDDGKTDLYVANDQWRNSMFKNAGGRFEDVSDETGTGYPQEGPTAFGRKTRSGMGLATGDLDNDGRPDLFVTNYAAEPNTLYRNVEGVVFEQSERQALGGDQDPSIPLSGWGVVAIDYDNDGRDDLAVSNGQIMSRFFTVVAKWVNPIGKNFDVGEKSYAQRQFLFHNEGAPGQLLFRDVSAESGDLGRMSVVGRGLAAGDLDGDGRPDLVFNPIDVPAVVLKNEAPAGKAIEILPVAGADRKTVLGTRVTVNGRRKDFYVVPSYASASWLPLRFGLGAAETGEVNVRWPDGTTEELGTIAAGAYRLRKGERLTKTR